MFGGKHATDGRGLYDAKKKAGDRQRKQFLQITPINGRKSNCGQSLRDVAKKLHPSRFQRKNCGGNDTANHDEKRDRFVFQKNLTKNQNRERDSAGEQGGRMGLVEMLEKNPLFSQKLPCAP